MSRASWDLMRVELTGWFVFHASQNLRAVWYSLILNWLGKYSCSHYLLFFLIMTLFSGANWTLMYWHPRGFQNNFTFWYVSRTVWRPVVLFQGGVQGSWNCYFQMISHQAGSASIVASPAVAGYDIYSFIQQIVTKYMLCAQLYPGSWRYSSEQKRQNSCLFGAHLFKGR